MFSLADIVKAAQAAPSISNLTDGPMGELFQQLKRQRAEAAAAEAAASFDAELAAAVPAPVDPAPAS